jgi:hypothetical protein
MALPVPQFRPPPLPEPNPVVRVVAREDVEWNRPIFRAPSLEVQPWLFGAPSFAEELGGGAAGGR